MRDRAMMPDPGIRFLLDRGSTFLRDRPGDAASVLEMFVRRVDDGIHRFDGDVALHNLKDLTRWKFSFNKNGVHTRKI